MHIAVSLSGEGSGHATRMAALCGSLAERHNMTVWCPPSARTFMQPRLPSCRFETLPPMRSVWGENRIRVPATVVANAGLFLKAGRRVAELARDLDQLRVDAAVCDYEPFLARAARRVGIPVIQLSHQGVIDRHPALRPDWLAAWLLNRLMMPPASETIVSSFYNGDVGALLRPEIAGRRADAEDFVVVYAREGFAELILPVLKWFVGTSFRVYPGHGHEFARSLAACRGVIAPAGHQLISEALHLRKPVLAFPQSGQYEQELNARMLERSGWGMLGRTERIDAHVARFLGLIRFFPLRRADRRVMFRFHDCTDQAARRIELALQAWTNHPRRAASRRPRRALTPRRAA